jgi:hypothetical protein
MSILPGFDKMVKPYMSPTQYEVFMIFHWLMILLYLGLTVLVITNTWQILIRLGRWRNPPLLAFYTFTFIVVVSRDLISTMYYAESPGWKLSLYLNPVAKLAVGLIQTWMIFEIAMRIRQGVINERDLQTDTTLADKLITRWQIAVVVLISAVFLGYALYLTYLCVYPEQFTRHKAYFDCIGICFLTVGLLMGCSNAFLSVQIKAKNRALNLDSNAFEKEQFTLIIIFVFFGVSYLIRSIWNFISLTYQD